jgi:hypothetical protein
MLKPESIGTELPEELTNDVDNLVKIRQVQLAEKERVESLLESEPSSLSSTDQQLVEDYKSGKMIDRHNRELLEASERQDPELMDAREIERISKRKKYVVDGKELYAEGDLKEYSGYKVGKRYEEKYVSDYALTIRIEILGFTEVNKDDGHRLVIVERREGNSDPVVTTINVTELNKNYFKPTFFKRSP